MTFLGIESEWLKYEGRCIIFVGLFKDIKYDKEYNEEIDDGWILENENETTKRLINGLTIHGIKCDEIMFEWEDKMRGTRSCKCICYYNKPYETYHSEFFLKGFATDEFTIGDESFMEFYFTKRLY